MVDGWGVSSWRDDRDSLKLDGLIGTLVTMHFVISSWIAKWELSFESFRIRPDGRTLFWRVKISFEVKRILLSFLWSNEESRTRRFPSGRDLISRESLGY